jgi:transposase
MPKRIRLEPHLDTAALEQRYRQAPDPVGRTHFQILWLRAGGRTVEQAAEVTGYSRHWVRQLVARHWVRQLVARHWVRQLVARYHGGGPEALGDRRHGNPGGRWLLSPEQKAELTQALTEPPQDGGLWSGPKVAAWMGAKTGRSVHPQRGWDYLRLSGYSLQVPRPRHRKADPDAQAAFKKNTR